MTFTIGRRALIGALPWIGAPPCIGMTAFAPRLALASTRARREQRFVVVILRGAMDGLSAVAPVGDPDYARLRGRLAVAPPGQIDGGVALNAMFALHPALASLYPLYHAGEMLAVHAMASPYRDRSHFDAQAVIENGTNSASGAADGWLNRFLAVMGASRWQGSGFAFGSYIPLTLAGSVAVDNWCPTAVKPANRVTQAAVAAMYAADPQLAAAYASGQASALLAGSANAPGGGAGLPPFARLAQAAGEVMAADGGPNVATIEAFGWDTHVGQGAANGALARELAALAQGIVALKTALGPRWASTAVVAVTEFGRTAAPNTTGGTDHGTAGAGFAFGGAIAGGRVLANWPGLSKAALYQGRDLAPTLDIRSFLKGVLGDYFRLSSDALATVFPSSAAAPPVGGLIRT